MRRFRLYTLPIWLFCLLCVSCSIDQHFEFPQGPQGPQGPAGLSAYDLWVEYIKEDPTYQGGYDLPDFFIYLKGKDGKDGINGIDGIPGIDGVDGKSAYEIWKEEVAKGIKDPHNPGQDWDKNATDMVDFWWFLTGKDGLPGTAGSVVTIEDNGNWHIDGQDTGIPATGPKGEQGKKGAAGSVVTVGENGNWHIDGQDTLIPARGPKGDDGAPGKDGLDAYALWKRDVAKGLENPHDPGNNWPKDQTDMEDFWEYLRGADGDDGEPGKDGKPGESGSYGGTVEIVEGQYNVIAQYSVQEYSEYVRWTDGKVLYKVYDKNKTLLPHATVFVPGISTPFESDDNGEFLIPKELLPKNKPIEQRFGQSIVNGEKSAGNTYVPEKIEIRFRMRTPNITLSGGNVVVNTVVERRTEVGKAWAVIPTYLGDLERPAGDPPSSSYIKIYWAEKGKPERPYYTTSSVNLSSTTKSFALSRPKVPHPYLDDAYEAKNDPWKGVHQYCVHELDSYYGEKKRLMAYDETGKYDNPKYVVMHKAPIQRLPVIKDVKMGVPYTTSKGENITEPTEGVFDLSSVDNQYFYNLTLEREDIGDEAWFTAVPMGDAAANNLSLLGVGFKRELESGQSDAKTGDQLLKLNDTWHISTVVYDGAQAYVYTTNTNQFVGAAVTTSFTFGTLSFTNEEISGLAEGSGQLFSTTIPSMPIQFPK